MRKVFLLITILFSSRVYAVTATEYYNIGLKFYSGQDYKLAIQSFDSALKLEPNNVAAILGRANCYYSLKKYEHSLADYRKVQALQPQNAEVNKFIQSLQAKIESSPHSIVWRTPAEGLAESTRTQKPILYDITAEWCPRCQELKKGVFEDKNCAGRINLLFVPVRVLDRSHEEGKNSQEVSDIEAKYKSPVFPTLVVQYPGKSDFKKISGYGWRSRIMGFLNKAVE